MDELGSSTLRYDHENPYSRYLQVAKEKIEKNLRYPGLPSSYPLTIQLPSELVDEVTTQFEIAKFLGSDVSSSHHDEVPHVKFKLVQPVMPDLPGMKEPLRFSDNWHYEPKGILAKDLQVTRMEPWSEIIYERSVPINLLYQHSDLKNCRPMDCENLMKVHDQGDLAPVITMPPRPPPQFNLALIDLKEMELVYPGTLPCEYFMELARRQVEELRIQEEMAKLREPVMVDLPDTALEVLQAMEGYLDVFWKMLLDLNLPEFADPLKRCRTVTELDPDRTRQCLISLKAEIAQSKRHSIESQGVMEKFLPGMLSLHGINKTVDLFLNVDFQSAFEALYHFRKTHDAILPSEFKMATMRLQEWNNLRGSLHPKLLVLCDEVVRQLKEYPRGKIWVRLHRSMDKVASKIQRLLAEEAGVGCSVDPKVANPSERLKWVSWSVPEDIPVVVCERLPKDFPLSSLSLIIDYEGRSCKSASDEFEAIPLKPLITKRPIFIREKEATGMEESGDSYNADAIDQSMPEEEIHSEAVPLSVPDPGMDVNPQEEDDPSDVDQAEETPSDGTATEELPLSDEEESGEEFQDSLEPSQERTGSAVETNPDATDGESHSVDPAAEVADEALESPIKEEDKERPAIMMAFHLNSSPELVQAVMDAGPPLLFQCDYSFLKSSWKWQPDFLLNSSTAILVARQDVDSYRDVRLKVLVASYSCSTCWVIVLAPGTVKLGRPPPFWHQLIGLARYYECKGQGRPEAALKVRLRLALTYHQVGYIVNDVARDLASQDVKAHLQPVNEQVERLLCHPQFNAVSAQLILEHLSPAEVDSLPLEQLRDRLPSRTLRRRIKSFRHAQQQVREEQATAHVEEPRDFGQLKCRGPEDEEESEATLPHRSPSNKKVRLDEDQSKRFESTDNLLDLWKSPA